MKKEVKSLGDAIKERKEKMGTLDNKFSEFPVGSSVKVITYCQDFTFFKGNEEGIVIENKEEYLGIIVRFSKDFTFNFAPSDLKLIRRGKPLPVETFTDKRLRLAKIIKLRSKRTILMNANINLQDVLAIIPKRLRNHLGLDLFSSANFLQAYGLDIWNLKEYSFTKQPPEVIENLLSIFLYKLI